MYEDLFESDHKLIMNNRKLLSLSGVRDVDSFDEREISVSSVMGEIIITGEGLKINSLSTETGSLEIEGERINSLNYYGDKKESVGFFKKLFK